MEYRDQELHTYNVGSRDRLHPLTKSCNPHECWTDVSTLWIYSLVKAWRVAMHLSLCNSEAMNCSKENLTNATSRGGRHTHTDSGHSAWVISILKQVPSAWTQTTQRWKGVLQWNVFQREFKRRVVCVYTFYRQLIYTMCAMCWCIQLVCDIPVHCLPTQFC